MSMNKIVISAVIAAGLVFASANAFAMPAKAKEVRMDPHSMSMKMQKDLTLTEDQAKKVEVIFTDMQKDLKKLKDKTDAKIKKELTDAQAIKFDEMQKERMDRQEKMMKKA